MSSVTAIASILVATLQGAPSAALQSPAPNFDPPVVVAYYDEDDEFVPPYGDGVMEEMVEWAG